MEESEEEQIDMFCNEYEETLKSIPSIDTDVEGYLTSIKIKKSCKNLHGSDWYHIPMFSLVTGKNGIGKTALLDDIAKGVISDDDKFSQLSFREDVKPSTIQLFSFSCSKNEMVEPGAIYSSYTGESINKTVKSEMEKLEKNNPDGIPISIYGKAQSYCEYLLNKCGLEILNFYLTGKGFKYNLSSAYSPPIHLGGKYISESHEIQFKGDIKLSSLSPGEKLEFLMLLWLFDKENAIKHNPSVILLLDEPDAHMHPSLIKKFVDTIQNRLVSDLGIQVIMTTHNPITISLVPKKNIYVMKQRIPEPVKIDPVDTKSEVNQWLTDNVVYVNEPFKLVFVEAAEDARFYQLIQKQLVEKNTYPGSQLLFKSHNNTRSHDPDSSRDVVESLVKKCVETGNEDKCLKDFIFGLVDGDNKGKSSCPNVKNLERYALENYVYDPVHIFFALQWKKKNTETFKSMCADIQSKLNSDVPGSLAELLKLDPPQVTQILQVIVNKITELFTSFFYQEIKQQNNRKEYYLFLISSESEMDKVKLNPNVIVLQKSEEKVKVCFLENHNRIKKIYDLKDDFKKLTFPNNEETTTISPKNDRENLIGKIGLLCGLTDFNTVIARLEGQRFSGLFNPQTIQLDIQPEPVEFLNNIKLQYPKIILKMHGHDLQFVYGRLFERQLPIEFMFEFLEKEGALISSDLIDIFSSLSIPVEEESTPLPLTIENSPVSNQIKEVFGSSKFQVGNLENELNRKGLSSLSNENLITVLNLPKGFKIGKAVDDGGCFFDALAQVMNRLKKTTKYTEKSLRMLCHKFYLDNKGKVDQWNKEDNRLDQGEEYFIVQYTKSELEKYFNGRASVWGRGNVEGRILCNQLNLTAIHLIELIIDPENKQTVATHFLITSEKMTQVKNDDIPAYTKNIPLLVVSQADLHFVPILSKEKNLKLENYPLEIQKSQVFKQESSVNKEKAREFYHKGKAAFYTGNKSSAITFFLQAKDSYKDVLANPTAEPRSKAEAEKRVDNIKNPDGKYSPIKLSK